MVVALPQNRQIADADTLRDCKNEIDELLDTNTIRNRIYETFAGKIQLLSDENLNDLRTYASSQLRLKIYLIEADRNYRIANERIDRVLCLFSIAQGGAGVGLSSYFTVLAWNAMRISVMVFSGAGVIAGLALGTSAGYSTYKKALPLLRQEKIEADSKKEEIQLQQVCNQIALTIEQVRATAAKSMAQDFFDETRSLRRDNESLNDRLQQADNRIQEADESIQNLNAQLNSASNETAILRNDVNGLRANALIVAARNERSKRAYRALKFSTRATINEVRRQRKNDVNALKRDMRVMKDEFTAMISSLQYYPTDDPIQRVLQGTGGQQLRRTLSAPTNSAALEVEHAEGNQHLQQEDQDYEHVGNPAEGSPSSSQQLPILPHYQLSPSDAVAHYHMERAEQFGSGASPFAPWQR